MPVEFPHIARIDRILQAALLGEQLFHLLVRHGFCQTHGDLFEFRQQGAFIGNGFLNVLQDVLLGIQHRLLRQKANRSPRSGESLSGKILVHPSHDAQESTLTGAVSAEDTDLGSGIKG